MRAGRGGLREHPGGTSRKAVRLWPVRQDGRAMGFAQCDGRQEKCGKYCEDAAITRPPISGHDFAIDSKRHKF